MITDKNNELRFCHSLGIRKYFEGYKPEDHPELLLSTPDTVEKDKKWYGFESYAEGSSLDAVQLTKEEFAIVKKIFDTGETLYDEGYSGSFSLFGSTDGYDSKLDVLREYAKERYIHREDITDEDMAMIIEEEQNEKLIR